MDIFEKIRESEKKGIFDAHITPVNPDMAIPLEEYNYPFERKLPEKIKYETERIFVAEPYTLYLNKRVFKTEVSGRENLRGLRAAVITCNHIEMFDCLTVRYALRGHRLFAVGAPFNNMRGFLGEMMRAGDMIPLGDSLKNTRRFNKEVGDILTNRKDFLLIYPEASMWQDYEKPRPYKNGAFDIAAKYKVPLVPIFITLRDSGKKKKDGSDRKYFKMNIGAPIYPDPEKNRSENSETLKNKAFEFSKKTYEDYYGRKLTYLCDNPQKEN